MLKPTIEYRAAEFVEHVLPRATMDDLDADRLVDFLAADRTPRSELWEIAAGMGAPAEDCLCTVLSARATLMAAGRGRAFYQHELRGRIPMPAHLEPEVKVWEGGTVPSWEDGVYVEPKYFSFRQDAPFAAYNPIHRKKWRAHELLHGAVGFFWRADMTRFEAYVGARLNELLPVVHWYELDEIFRPRCDRHRGEVLFREFCPDCEAVVRPYWEVDPDDNGRGAVQFVRNAQEHFFREMATCRREIETGRAIETPLGRLNASSDAVGYLLGHWPRMTAWSFRTWAELFLRPGFDYFDDLRAYADRVEACAARLVGGAVVVTQRRFEALRQRRTLQDIAYRALLSLEWLDPDSAVGQAMDRTIMGALERCSAAVDDLVDSDAALYEAEDALLHLCEVLRDVQDGLPDEVGIPLCSLGLSWFEQGRDREWEIFNIAEGLSQAAPLTSERLDAGHLETFVSSPQFRTTGRLGRRFASYLRDRARRKPAYAAIADLAALEAWAADDLRVDSEAEHFGQQPEGLDNVKPSQLRLNRTFRRASFGRRAVGEILEWDLPEDVEEVELAAAYWREQFHVVFVDDTVAASLGAVSEGRSPADEEALLELIDAGLVVWIPTVAPPEANES